MRGPALRSGEAVFPFVSNNKNNKSIVLCMEGIRSSQFENLLADEPQNKTPQTASAVLSGGVATGGAAGISPVGFASSSSGANADNQSTRLWKKISKK